MSAAPVNAEIDRQSTRSSAAFEQLSLVIAPALQENKLMPLLPATASTLELGSQLTEATPSASTSHDLNSGSARGAAN